MKKIQINSDRGFTLIELLVVISIISLLASVILANVKSGRAKSKDAFLKEEASQLRTLMALQFNETGSYLGLQPSSWVITSADCANISLSGNYVTQTRDICNAIVRNSSVSWTTNKFYLGTQSGASDKYSIMIALSSKDTFFCMGSTGTNSDTDLGTWVQPGCWSNP